MRLSKIKKILAAFFLICFYFQADASLVININKGVMKPVSIALHIQDFSKTIGDKFSEVISKNLQGTYLFRSIPKAAFMQSFSGLEEEPKFALWKMIDANYLLNAEMKIEGGRLYINCYLYDVLSEMKVGRFSANGNVSDWKKMAHLISNNIYERITGEVGYFDTKILYVQLKKDKKGRKTYQIAMMDQDGDNHEVLTDGTGVVLTPRFAPGGKEFSYFKYKEKRVNGRIVPVSGSVYRYDLRTRRSEMIAKLDGMTYAPRYSPDGNFLIFSLSHRGSSSIYTLNLTNAHISRLTKGPSIDTSPCYSPDGAQIVFNSDRGGSQQLYVMNSDGSNVRRLSFQKGRYATPVWSPRGDWIAFTKFGNGGFYIGIIRPDGSGERMLASGYLVEGPTWSPNGRVILYSYQNYAKKEKIRSVDVTGYNEHEIPTPFGAIDPEWGGKIK